MLDFFQIQDKFLSQTIINEKIKQTLNSKIEIYKLFLCFDIFWEMTNDSKEEKFRLKVTEIKISILQKKETLKSCLGCEV